MRCGVCVRVYIGFYKPTLALLSCTLCKGTCVMYVCVCARMRVRVRVCVCLCVFECRKCQDLHTEAHAVKNIESVIGRKLVCVSVCVCVTAVSAAFLMCSFQKSRSNPVTVSGSSVYITVRKAASDCLCPLLLQCCTKLRRSFATSLQREHLP